MIRAALRPGFSRRAVRRSVAATWVSPRGAVGTWEFRIIVEAPVAAGGGFLFERHGFLLSHSVQNTRPRGRDYVTLHAATAAGVRLELNELNQAHWPSFARIVVDRGSLAPGDELRLLIGDTSQGRFRQRGL